MSTYLVGLATLPALALAGWLLFWAWLLSTEWLYQRGITFEWSRPGKARWTDYTLRHDACWERQAGPFMAGHWYRNNALEHAATRWWGVGQAEGYCLLVLRKRNFEGASHEHE